MNILEFNLDIWKLFAEQIGILELKNLLFVNKELFEKVSVLAGTNSLVDYKECYEKEYYSEDVCTTIYHTCSIMTKTLINNKKINNFKIKKDLYEDELEWQNIEYKSIDFKNRREYNFAMHQMKIFIFSNCINLPIEYDYFGLLKFNNCVLTGSLTIIKAYVVKFIECDFEKDFKIIISDGCGELDVLECRGYMPIIEGEIDEKKIRNNNFVKIEN